VTTSGIGRLMPPMLRPLDPVEVQALENLKRVLEA
jgi:hypothetical protein